jgi:hypothetical protein
MLNRRLENNMPANLITKSTVSNHDLIRKGEIVMYEGKEAEVIRVNPLLTIKLNNRIICGDLHNQIEPLKESTIHNQTL